MTSVLVVNAGSSSLKLRVLSAADEVIASADLSPWDGRPDDPGLRRFLDGLPGIDAAGHRVVHGGHGFTAATPIDDEHSQIVQFCLRSDREEDVPAADAIAFDRKITEEDRYILESTDPDVPLTETARERNMASDKLGVLMRRRLLALLREHGEEEVRAAAAGLPAG